VLALAFLGANQLGALASSSPQPAPRPITVAVLRLPPEPNDRCLKRVIAKYSSLGGTVLADRVKQCRVVTVVTPRAAPVPCLGLLSGISLAGLPPANKMPIPGCVGVTPRGS
jgi:hypothetical protein